jgi:hypothetical protein
VLEPSAIAREIVEKPTAALAEFEAVALGLEDARGWPKSVPTRAKSAPPSSWLISLLGCIQHDDPEPVDQPVICPRTSHLCRGVSLP